MGPGSLQCEITFPSIGYSKRLLSALFHTAVLHYHCILLGCSCLDQTPPLGLPSLLNSLGLISLYAASGITLTLAPVSSLHFISLG